MKQKVMAKIMAGIALWAILIGIIGTGIIFIMTSWAQKRVDDNITKKELDTIIKQFSGSIDVQWSDNQIVDITETTNTK